jgi:arginase
MDLSRRHFSLIAGSLLFAGRHARAEAPEPPEVRIVLAPSNLGLRPEDGKEPGTWQAPRVLMAAGLRHAVEAAEVMCLERPLYDFEAQPDTRMRNGQTLRKFSLELAETVRAALDAHRFPVVIGGDCGILLGCLYGLRLAGGRGLVHVDGHSDFAQAKSYATPETLGAAAGMDLALVSGRGEPIMTEWPGVDGPLAADADIVQVGERGRDDPGFMQYYGDILATEITRVDVQDVLAEGIDAAARRVLARFEARGLDRAWLHVDLDVLDEKVMPAVDSPGTPGFDYGQLSALVGLLAASGRVAGMDFAIYDPERDAGHAHAAGLVACIAAGVRPRRAPRSAPSRT